MAILKCKMCGGDIELSADKTFGTCESCGSTMTFPKVDDDQRANMFNRGNHFRRQGEFDKALAVYERIVQEDENDAEAHWCCALCRFGIEYVEDPNTYEYLPTCHRASFDSFLEDVDYLAALEHSDGITKRQYQKDAAKIAEVQRGILATSQNEEPFDVFICYKESENDGTRTRDSLLAQDIYYQLTEQGRRVFFSRITLEDKAGTEYEPYIFAALNSAKVMIVVTTSAEHVNAVWVKNEWSRFLSLMRKDRSKILLPCYRDMDPYDLPEALSVLQSYDMGKIGFIQDLIRGVNKMLDGDKPKETVKETVVIQQQAQSSTAPLLKRAFMFLEDGDFARADEFCEQVLNQDPENAEAYLGKLMAELKVRNRKGLQDVAMPFDSGNIYEKVMRFGTPELKSLLTDANAHIRERNETARKEGIYQKASQALTLGQYDDAIRGFASVIGYKNAGDRKAEAERKKENERKNAIYENALNAAKTETVVAQTNAMHGFRSIPGWKDADARAAACEKKIAELRDKAEAERIAAERKAEEQRIEAERKAEEERIAAEQRQKKARMIGIIVAVVAVAAIAAVVLLFTVFIPNANYNKAMELYNAGQYEEAISTFEALNGYKDSAAQIEACQTAIKDQQYDAAVSLSNASQYESAIETFQMLNGYKDSEAQIEVCQTAIKDREYDAAVALYNAGQYEEAIEAFRGLNGYKDSAELMELCDTAIKNSQYDAAIAIYEAGKYEDAFEQFVLLTNYKDAATMREKCVLAIMKNAVEEDQPSAFLSAARLDEYNALLPDNKDTVYSYAIVLAKADLWSLAQKCFKECGDYKNAEKYYDYVTARDALLHSEWESAIESFSKIKGFEDSDRWLDSSYYQAVTNGTVSLEKALEYLGKIQDYSDQSAELLKTCQSLSKCAGEYKGTVKENRKDGKRDSYADNMRLEFCLVEGVPYVERTGSWLFSAVPVETGTDGYTFMANFDSSNGTVKCWFSSNKAKEDNPGLKVICFFSK